jgi:hypothetical protein
VIWKGWRSLLCYSPTKPIETHIYNIVQSEENEKGNKRYSNNPRSYLWLLMNCPMLCAIAAHPSWWLLLAELLGEPFDRRSFDNPLSICSTLYKPTSEACLAVRVLLGAPAWSYLATTSSTVCNRVLALYAIVAHSSQQGDAKCSRSRHIVQSNGAPFLHGHSIVEMSCFLNFPYSAFSQLKNLHLATAFSLHIWSHSKSA